ncbi:MAG: alpha/beta hydrolase [Pseudomonadota bacterium]
MLIFTNRMLNAASSNASALSGVYTPFLDTLNSVSAQPSANGTGWKVSRHQSELTDPAALVQLSEALSGSKPVLVYVHGNNNPPTTCFTRCQELEDQYGVAVIGYSWTSEGFLPNGQDPEGMDNSKPNSDADEDALSAVKSKESLKEGPIARKARRYGQAKLNAQHSKESLARFLRLVAAARLGTVQQKVSLAAHSLGCHFLHYAVNEQDAEASLSALHNVVLLAGCTGAAKHTAWIEQIHPLLKVYLTYTQADSVLFAANLVDGDVKLGAVPGDERLAGPKYRYIDFEGAAKMKFAAHRYFVADPGKKLSKQATNLFQRIFSSELDFDPAAESPKVVYPVGCSTDGSVCFMGSARGFAGGSGEG